MIWRIPPLRWRNFLKSAYTAALISPERALDERLRTLETHLQAEHPDLLAVLPIVRTFDRVLADLGLLGRGESLASRIAWWPSVSVLGLYSAGKSSFINSFLELDLQATGNQAVDDLFTVICHGGSSLSAPLPGSAINADMRFPFFRIADRLDRTAGDEGRHIDSYLQLKTCPSPRLKGRIIIDSPGFDAGSQRQGTLRIVEHIVEVSDLVLIFFDARRPEPGAMQDLLRHLVEPAARRTDATKMLFILNQCDNAAREDNLEDVVGAWQRSLSQAGLTIGRFYCIYHPAFASQLAGSPDHDRHQDRCRRDLAEIHARIAGLDSGRGYRLLGQLEALARELEHKTVPQLEAATAAWRRTVLFGGWRRWGGAIRREIGEQMPERLETMGLSPRDAFLRNTSRADTLLRGRPAGWGRARMAIPLLRHAIEHQTLIWNNRHAGLVAPQPTPGKTPAAPTTAARPPKRRPPAPRERACGIPAPSGPEPEPESIRTEDDPVIPLLQTESLLTKVTGLFSPGVPKARGKASPPTHPDKEGDIDFFED